MIACLPLAFCVCFYFFVWLCVVYRRHLIVPWFTWELVPLRWHWRPVMSVWKLYRRWLRQDEAIVPKGGHADRLEGRFWIAVERVATVGHFPWTWSAIEAALFRAEDVLCSAEFRHQVLYASEASLRKVVVQLQLDNTRTKDQRDLEVRCGGCRQDLLDSAGMKNRNLHRIILELQAKYVQELEDLRSECNGYQPGLPLMIVSMESLKSLDMMPFSIWRGIKVLSCLGTCPWSWIGLLYIRNY